MAESGVRGLEGRDRGSPSPTNQAPGMYPPCGGLVDAGHPVRLAAADITPSA